MQADLKLHCLLEVFMVPRLAIGGMIITLIGDFGSAGCCMLGQLKMPCEIIFCVVAYMLF